MALTVIMIQQVGRCQNLLDIVVDTVAKLLAEI